MGTKNEKQYLSIPSPVSRGIMDFKPRKNKKMNILIDCMTSAEIDLYEKIVHLTFKDANGFQIKIQKNMLKYDLSVIEILKDFDYFSE